MNDENKDKPLKKLSKELLKKQIKNAEEFVQYANQQISGLQAQVQQNIGIANFSKHLLEQFELPEKTEEQKGKPELEVK